MKKILALYTILAPCISRGMEVCEYTVIHGPFKNEKVKLLEMVALTYELARKNINPEVHDIVVQRIKSHEDSQNLMKQLKGHRQNSTLSTFFESLPIEIKDKPLYFVQFENEQHYVERDWLTLDYSKGQDERSED